MIREKLNWKRAMYILGILALLFGGIDPLEGAIFIGAGSILVALTTFLTRDRHWKIFLTSSILILFGIFFLFYFSSQGGLGGNSVFSWWWGILVLPYPIGWITTVVTLIITIIQKVKQNLGSA